MIDLKKSQPVPVLERPLTTVNPSSSIDPASLPTSLADIRSALAAIPNEGSASLDYDAWRNLVFAVHHATQGSAEGHALIHEWSSRSDKYDPEFLDERVWPYIKSERDNGITAATLFAKARQHGWQEDIASEFEVLPDLEPTSVPGAPTDAGTKQRFKTFTVSEFANRPAPRWIIKGILPDAELVVIVGQPGSGKSFLALDIALDIAQGASWRGYRTKHGKVVYIAAEGADGFRNRLVAALDHRQLQVGSRDSLQLHVISDTPNLLQKDDVRSVAQSVQALGKIDVLIVDTLARATAGVDENSAEQMGRVLSHCSVLRRATGAVVVLVHHLGKDDSRGPRGWSGVTGAADAIITVTRSELERKATVSKLKDGHDGFDLPFRLKTVQIGEDADGDAIESCVVEHIEAAGRQRREPKGKVERLVWRLAHDMMLVGDDSVAVGTLIDGASGQLAHDPAKRDRRREVITQALQSLTEGRFLTVENNTVKAHA